MYAHICSEQVAMSRPRLRRMATHSATGAAKATPWVTSGGALTRLRTSGAAAPARTTVQAVARIALGTPTGRGVYEPLLARERRLGALRGGHERADHRAVLVGLRMPLHAEHETPARQLDRLRQLIERGDAADLEPLAEAIDALVVMRL